ncbi:hypothetical protein D9619_010467 [Psilocybe cf. subviscida]|uniref:RRM domain-containing protein n=1 Tax=Psilocybe cf. subviscida TaxID=2480587 RepID=A0A8H5ES09_9AGAR|nr:hypothetical protein D9619_010467 [Psilocybe cf. subviscida]
MASTSATTLDDLIPSPTSPDVVPLPPRDDHLFYPSLDEDEAAGRDTPPAENHPRPVLTDRLYVGNLHPTVDEYTLLQVFSKFGRVTKLDYLFHKAGPLKGKPRGYAFLEYADKDVSPPVSFIHNICFDCTSFFVAIFNSLTLVLFHDMLALMAASTFIDDTAGVAHIEAHKALTMAHDKLLRGRKLVVTFAQQAPLDQYPGGALKNRKTMMDVGRPTTLSMIKSSVHGRHHEGKTQDKIARMEAKLRQMERTNPKPKAPSPTEMDTGDTPPSSVSTPKSHPSLPNKPPSPTPDAPSASLPYHPSLPVKPPPIIPGLQPPASHHPVQRTSSPAGVAFGSTKKALPKDPQELAAPLIKSMTATATTTTRGTKAHKLVGVKIKAKEKPKVGSPQPLV